jgi:predicted nuclease of predicted toxin-antitoxin system
VKWLADENLRHAIVRGLLRRAPGFDILRIRDIGLAAERDTTVLEWAATNDRVLVTHDLATMVAAMRPTKTGLAESSTCPQVTDLRSFAFICG